MYWIKWKVRTELGYGNEWRWWHVTDTTTIQDEYIKALGLSTWGGASQEENRNERAESEPDLPTQTNDGVGEMRDSVGDGKSSKPEPAEDDDGDIEMDGGLLREGEKILL